MRDIVRLFSMLEVKFKHVVVVVVCIIIISVSNYAHPFITQMLIDNGMLNNNISIIVKMSIITLSLTIVSSIAYYIKEVNRLKIYNDSYLKLEKETLMHLMATKISYFDEANVTGLQKMVEDDIAIMTSIVSNETFDVLTSFFAAIAGGIALFRIDYHLCIAVILFIPLDYLLTTLLSKKNYKIVVEKNNKRKCYSESFGEIMGGMEEVRILGIQKKNRKRLLDIIAEILSLNKRQSLLRCIMQQSQLILIELILVALYIISGILLIKSKVSMGGIIAFQTYALMLYDPIESAIDMIFEISSLKPSVQRYINFMNNEEEKSGNIKQFTINNIVFDNVTFTYDSKDEMIFQNFNLSINKGDKIVITGNNGAGKTTLIKILLKFFVPINGSVKINGHDLESLDLKSYRSCFSVVSQNIFMFNTSIRDNICMNYECTPDELNRVIELVNLKQLIDENGLDYNVGVNGSKLSGGQIQKIALARAIVQNREIIILDEATSNVDQETAEIIKSIINNQLKERTIICISHNSEIINIFDKKVVINDGVKAKKGVYKK